MNIRFLLTIDNHLDRRRDEIVQLRAVLATQTKGLKNIAKINYGSTTDINLDVINEDGELVVAFEAQKGIIRSLSDLFFKFNNNNVKEGQ